MTSIRASSESYVPGCRYAPNQSTRELPDLRRRHGPGAETLLDIADRYDVALVVVGARGVSGFKSLLLGSVSYGVAQHAHLPVLVVPAALSEEQRLRVRRARGRGSMRRRISGNFYAPQKQRPADRHRSTETLQHVCGETHDASQPAPREREDMNKQTSEWKPGDVLIVAGCSVDDIPREGEILEVLGGPDHPHFSVRWDDGHESIFYPAHDVALRHPPSRP